MRAFCHHDIIILCGEAATAIISAIATGGFLTPAVLAAFKKVEVGFAAIKTVVLGFIPFVVHTGAVGVIPVHYGLNVAALSKVP